MRLTRHEIDFFDFELRCKDDKNPGVLIWSKDYLFIFLFFYITRNILEKRWKNPYLIKEIEVEEDVLEIPLGFTCISNLSFNNKIGIRRIASEIESEASHPFTLEVDDYTQSGSMNYIYGK
jgi:hypothetical protein